MQFVSFVSFCCLDNTVDFDFTLSHSDMNNIQQSTYKLGDYIKFKMQLNSDVTDTKAVIQECWASSNGVADKYNLISYRFVNFIVYNPT